MLDPDDHRSLGQRLDLFHFDELAPGMVFWHPRGYAVYRALEGAARARTRADGYEEVRTPQILRRPVWESSGHWQHFANGMFRVEDGEASAAIKPVSCPGHIQLVAQRAPSYRDLPIRLAEFGLVHRDEPGGTLHGLLRLRQFTQDDGHVFCSEEHVARELERFCRSLPIFYRSFGFDGLSVHFATRPAERAGSAAQWDWAEAALARVLERLGIDYARAEGQGAFYGPKLEFALTDRLGRSWQCGTIQLDLVMPQRFELRYVNASSERPLVVMLHRALFGSLERFMAILLEHYKGALPPWLSPTQVQVLPVAAEHTAAARAFAALLARHGVRAEFDSSDDSLSRRIALAHSAATPLIAILGARELEEGSVTVRTRWGQEKWDIQRAADEIRALCAPPDFGSTLGLCD